MATLHKNLKPDIPALVFFMTDAGFHAEDDKSISTLAEKRLLRRWGYSTDFFEIWAKLDHHQICFCPFVFTNKRKNDYGQLAKQSKGLFLKFDSSDPSKLSTEMMGKIRSIFTELSGNPTPTEYSPSPGVHVMNLDSISPRTRESEPIQGFVQPVDAHNVQLYFQRFVEEFTSKVNKKNWPKKFKSLLLLNRMKVLQKSLEVYR